MFEICNYLLQLYAIRPIVTISLATVFPLLQDKMIVWPVKLNIFSISLEKFAKTICKQMSIKNEYDNKTSTVGTLITQFTVPV